MLLKNAENNKINSAALLFIFTFLAIFFRIDKAFILILFIGVFFAIALRINYKIATVLILYFLVPSDSVKFMFVNSPFGSFPVYILLMFAFIIIGWFEEGFSVAYDKSEFEVFLGLIVVIALQVLCILYFNSLTIFPSLIKYSFQTLGMLLLIRNINIDEDKIIRICYFIIGLSLISVVIGVLEIFAGFNIYKIYGQTGISEWIEWQKVSSSIWRASSTFANPLVFSSSMIMSLVSVEYIRNKTSKNLLIMMLLGIIAIGVLVGGSRSSIIIFGVYLLYYIKQSDIKSKMFIFFCVAIIALFIFRFMNLELVFSRFSESSSDGSMRHRFTAYFTFFTVFGRFFFTGAGLGHTYEILNEYIEGTFTTNTFDNALMDYGLAVGGIGLLFTFFSIFKLYNICNEKHMAKSALIFFVATSFFMDTTKYQAIWGMLWFYFALSLYSCDEMGEEEDYLNA